MRNIFPVRGRDDDGTIDRCRRFMHRYCHPVQIGTGLVFSTVGIGIVAAGVLYADGLNFLAHSVPQIPAYVSNGTDIQGSVDYMRESYRGSVAEAIDAGWKQVPFSYCIGHFVGGKVLEKVSAPFRRR